MRQKFTRTKSFHTESTLYGEVGFVRHGQSPWNAANRFTGWVDVPLSQAGRQEAIAAAQKLAPIQSTSPLLTCCCGQWKPPRHLPDGMPCCSRKFSTHSNHAA